MLCRPRAKQGRPFPLAKESPDMQGTKPSLARALLDVLSAQQGCQNWGSRGLSYFHVSGNLFLEALQDTAASLPNQYLRSPGEGYLEFGTIWWPEERLKMHMWYLVIYCFLRPWLSPMKTQAPGLQSSCFWPFRMMSVSLKCHLVRFG